MRPETKAKYPKDWPDISMRIKAERKFECEGCGQAGSKLTGCNCGNNYITVHHVDYDPSNNDPGNLMVLCQKCHLRLQNGVLPWRSAIAAGQLPLFL